jgi:plastocyanin
MRRIFLSLVIAALLAPVAFAATTDVKVKDDFFKPDEVTIDKGDQVRWLWRGDDEHNVAIKKPGSRRVARRSALKTDGKFVHQFGKVGTWRVLCEVHPRRMRMKVNVTAP